MADEREPEPEADPPEKERTKTLVRRIGRTIFIGGGFAMFVAMMIGVVQGIQQNRAWDPYTGRPQDEGKCLEEARELMMDAGERDRLSPSWIGRYREWVTDCKDSHGGVYQLLEDTHEQLQKFDDEES